MKQWIQAFRELQHLHRSALYMLQGSAQLTAVLILSAAAVYAALPQLPNMLRALSYVQGAMEMAPVVFATGVVCSLVCDLTLRRKNHSDQEEGPPHQEDGKPKKK